jgi:hypothetical protein
MECRRVADPSLMSRGEDFHKESLREGNVLWESQNGDN